MSTTSLAETMKEMGLTGPILADVMVWLGDNRKLTAIQSTLSRAIRGEVKPSGELLALLGAIERIYDPELDQILNAKRRAPKRKLTKSDSRSLPGYKLVARSKNTYYHVPLQD